MLSGGIIMMDEFQIRNVIIAKARKKYIPSKTMNISLALELYLRNDATQDERIPYMVSTNNRPKNWVDAAGRPNCPKCKRSLLLNQPEGKWVCSRCGYEKKIKAEICPDCKIEMRFYPVNTTPGDQTGDASKSMWMCPKCWRDEYSEKTITELLKQRNL